LRLNLPDTPGRQGPRRGLLLLTSEQLLTIGRLEINQFASAITLLPQNSHGLGQHI
jgi:hypothetical protein